MGSKNWYKKGLLGIAGIELSVAIGCASGKADTRVDWQNYSPDVKTRIDAMAAARDCTGLQKESDTAKANNTAWKQRNLVGNSNADLLAYINSKMKEAGCYSK